MRDKVYIIDASNMIHRAFHAMGDLSTSYGFPTGAIWGTMNMMIKFIKKHKPTHMIMAYDPQDGASVRKDIYPLYKANRPQVNSVSAEEKILRKMFEHMGILGLERSGYEADDIIASCAKALSPHMDVVIVTGDKDMLQLIGPNVSVFDHMKNVYYGDAEVMKKFGVKSNQISDYLAVAGDKVDNIPGVRGIGPKGAQELFKAYETLDEIYNNLDKVPEKLRTKLEASREDAMVSQKLTRLFDDICTGIIVPRVWFKFRRNESILALFDKLEFRGLKDDMEEIWDIYREIHREMGLSD